MSNNFLIIIYLFLIFFPITASFENIATAVEQLKTQTNKLLNETGQTLKKIEDDSEQEKVTGEKALDKPYGKISNDWKKQVDVDFSNDLEFLSKIVIEGEGDQEERQDFKNRFEELKKWFNKALSNTEYFFDSNYNALKQKKLSIAGVVKAQKIADEIIDEKSKQISFDKKLLPKIKLLVLYEINSITQKNMQEGVITDIELGVNYDQIKEIISNVIDQLRKEQKDFGVDLIIVQNLVLKLKQIKKELEQQDGMLDRLEKLIKNKFIKKDKKILELELLLKNQTEQTRRKVEDKFKGKLKDLKKTSLGFELKLKKNEKDTQLKLEAKLEERLADFKKTLTDKEKANLELQLLLRQNKKEKERLQLKIDQLKQELSLAEKQVEGDKEQKVEEELEFEQNAVANEDRRLNELFKDLDMVEKDLEKEKKAVIVS